MIEQYYALRSNLVQLGLLMKMTQHFCRSKWWS